MAHGDGGGSAEELEELHLLEMIVSEGVVDAVFYFALIAAAE